jgi:uncharacterized protein with gpF-like domain
MGRLTRHRASLWLRSQAAGERQLTKAIRRFLQEQLDRVLAALMEFDAPSPSSVPLVFHVAKEHERFMSVILPLLRRLMVQGATAELRWHEQRAAKSAAHDPMDDLGFSFGVFDEEVPANVLAGIKRHLADIAAQPYWIEIQQTTEKRLTEVIKEGIEAGFNGYRLGRSIRDAMGPATSKARAAAIARTESTGAINAGHYVQMQEVDADIIIAKEWSTAGDQDVRTTHSDVNGQRVARDADFEVPGGKMGDELAPYPGYYGLSPQNRCNCRCTIISVTKYDDDAQG